MTPSSFKPVSLSLSRISSILKHPNKSFLTQSIYVTSFTTLLLLFFDSYNFSQKAYLWHLQGWFDKWHGRVSVSKIENNEKCSNNVSSILTVLVVIIVMVIFLT